MIRNTTTRSAISQRTVEASTILGRMRGMLGRNFTQFDAMVFRRNNSIHMFFMRFPLDVIFLDSDDTVLAVRHRLKPWRMAAEFRASTVIELPSGTLTKTNLAAGDTLEIKVDATV